jgi:DNA-binding beta-propeller fold protein YncE
MSKFASIPFVFPLVLLALVGAAPALAQDSASAPPGAPALVAEFVWQSGGGPEPLVSPVDVAVHPDGNVWVVDSGSSRFQIFAPDGAFLEAWGTPGDGDGEFNFQVDPNDPSHGIGSVAFDNEGNIYVADTSNHRIQKFDHDRQFVTAWGSAGYGDGQFPGPISVAVDAAGNVFATDDWRDDVQKFDSDGTFLLKFGGHGSEDGQLNATGYLTVDGQGNVWIADWGNNRIQQFANDGTFLAAWGTYGDDAGELYQPLDVAVAADDTIYVADSGNGRIQVFNRDGSLLGGWGSKGEGAGQFAGLGGLALDGKGHIYVADWMSDRVQKFRLLPLSVSEATPSA